MQGIEGVFQVFMQHLSVNEKQCTVGLILGAGGSIFIHSQVGKKSLDFGSAHLGGVAFVMEEDEAVHPVHVRGLGAIGIRFEPQDFAQLVEKFLRRD
jgi:hypothetical protein